MAGLISPAELADLQRACREQVYVDPAIVQYVVRLVAATREPQRVGLAELAPLITWGASPRGTLHLVEAARALALLRGRSYVLPGDVQDLAADVLRHRLVLSYEALAAGWTPDAYLARLQDAVSAPQVPLQAVAAAQTPSPAHDSASISAPT